MLMNLDHQQFSLVKKGIKTVEIRLNDQKRRSLKIGDEITFIDLKDNHKLSAHIKQITTFDSFENLLSSYTATEVGSSKDDPLEKRVADMYQFYNVQQEKRYGVLAIELIVLPS